MTIGYVVQKYPELTLTFVYREVQALRAAGLSIDTFSTWKPRPSGLSAEARGLVDETFYIFPLNVPRFAGAHLRYLVTRPRRYLGALIFCLRHERPNLGRWVRAVGHFLQAGYLAQEVERRGIRHLHAHFARNAATLALIVGRLLDTTFSFTAHANDLFVQPTLLPEKIRAARFVVAISDYNRRFLQSLSPTEDARNKIHVVRYGLDVTHFRPHRQAQPTSEAPLILGIGRLVEKKGWPFLVQACQLLRERGLRFCCIIVGRGPQQVMLQRMIAAAGLDDCIRLAGAVFQEELLDCLAEASVFVLPCVIARDGDRDGIPNALIEAMAMAVPTVSTLVAGIPELIEHERSGLVVPPRDAPALAAALARLLEDAPFAAALGRAGRAKVVAEYEINANIQALLRIFSAELPASAGCEARPLRGNVPEALPRPEEIR